MKGWCVDVDCGTGRDGMAPNGEPAAAVAGSPDTRAVGDGASTPPTAERTGTGALVEVVRFSGIPKVTALCRISAPGDIAIAAKVIGDFWHPPARLVGDNVAVTTPEVARTGDIVAVVGLAALVAAFCATIGITRCKVGLPGITGTAPENRTSLRGLLPGVACGLGEGLASGLLAGGIPKAFTPPAMCTAGVAGDHGDPQVPAEPDGEGS